MMHRYFLLLMLVPLIVLQTGCGAGRVHLEAPQAPPLPGVEEPFSHAALDPILQVTVNRRTGVVDYGAIEEEFLTPLEEYLGRAAVADPEPWPVSDQKAFWINVHNAAALHSIASDWERFEAGRTSVRRGFLSPAPGYRVAGRWMTLSDMRRHIIRQFDDPRMIYTLHWGAQGSAPMLNRAYHAAELELSLPRAQERYLASRRGMRIEWDDREDVLVLTGLFVMYREELLGERADLLAAVRAINPDLRHAEFARIDKRRFDWTLAR